MISYMASNCGPSNIVSHRLLFCNADISSASQNVPVVSELQHKCIVLLMLFIVPVCASICSCDQIGLTRSMCGWASVPSRERGWVLSSAPWHSVVSATD